MEKIIQQKISADHLLYVSLKYTKTTDVILNLISRWTHLIEKSIDRLLEKLKENKKIDEIPGTIVPKIKTIKDNYNQKDIIQAVELFDFFRKMENLEKTREHEFRKNVTLSVRYKGKWTYIDLEKLKEYSQILEEFIKEMKKNI